MSLLALRADPEVVTSNVRRDWNRMNYQQRTMWIVIHGLPLLPLATSWEFDDLPEQIQDALFCEFFDLASRDLE